MVVALLVLVADGRPLAAAERYALIVTGASGEAKYVERYGQWRERLVSVFADHLAFGRDHVIALGETADGGHVPTRENVRRAIGAIAARMHKNDLLLVVLIGHGSLDGASAKFNLVGPDLDASEWASLLKTAPGRQVVVDTTGASFPFLAALSARGRVVITATDSTAARYDTVFPEYFLKALESASASVGDGGQVSIWDVFTRASAGVRRYYEQNGLLPVEHAMLDDAGDGFGKDAERPGIDASYAQAVLLTADPSDAGTDAATRELAGRRDDLLAAIERLKTAKPSMAQADYEAQLEKLLLELAKVSRDLRKIGRR